MNMRIATACVALIINSVICHAFETFMDCDLCPEMVVLPPGEFTMGSKDTEISLPDEKPAHAVKIPAAFAVGRFEVTMREWDACVADGSCVQVDDENWGRAGRPVINVNHTSAKGYTAWLSRKTARHYRLLSESEWEYAARGGTTVTWIWGRIEDGLDLPTACEYANTHDHTSRENHPGYAWLEHSCKDGFAHTAPEGSFKPNAFGLYDMLGNVAEWVEDCHAPYDRAPTDGSAMRAGECEMRVTRGGSWLSGPTWVRSAFRHPQVPGFAHYSVGFRVARDLP